MIAADRLKSFVDRIEILQGERKAVSEDIRDIFVEAKSAGFNGKALRRVLQRRAMDPSARQGLDELVDLYEHALGAKGEAAKMIAAGATVRQAAAATGVPRSTVGRVARPAAVPKSRENGTDAHDPNTGEIVETAGREAEPGAVGLARGAPLDAAAPSPATDAGPIPDFLRRARP